MAGRPPIRGLGLGARRFMTFGEVFEGTRNAGAGPDDGRQTTFVSQAWRRDQS